jgi:hypothetical protein
MQLLVPCENEYLRCKVTQKSPYRVEKHQTMSPSLERELCALLYEGEILTFRACEERRKDLARRHDFSTYACFRAVDELNEGEINVDNMRGFLKRAGHYPTEEEVIAIIRRVDTNADSSISYAEFSEAIKPQEFTMNNLYIVPPKTLTPAMPTMISSPLKQQKSPIRFVGDSVNLQIPSG